MQAVFVFARGESGRGMQLPLLATSMRGTGVFSKSTRGLNEIKEQRN
jgi:hypothetical protein